MTKERNGRFRWTEEQEQVIRELYPTLGAKKLAERLGVTVYALQGKARCMGVRMPEFNWTPEKEQIVRERYAKDGPKLLAEELGTTPWAVTAKSRRLGVEPPRRLPDFEWTPENVEKVRLRYVEESGDLLAKEFGVSIDTVRRKAAELGLRTIAGHAKAGKIRADNSTSCDIHFFDEWSPDMAYVLGFLFADGSITASKKDVRIGLASKDESVLEFIRTQLKAARLITREPGRLDPRTGKINQPKSTLIVSSTVLVSRLIGLGMVPRKTHTDEAFPDVPDGMMPHFARGYLDGDGTTCISSRDVCTVGFVGSPKFIVGLRDSLVRLADVTCRPVHTRIGKTANYCYIAWTAVTDIRKFHTYLYPNGYSFCLERKKRNLDGWLAVPRKVHHQRPWTVEDCDQVRNLYHVIGPTRLAKLMDRDVVTLRQKARKLGVLPINRKSL